MDNERNRGNYYLKGKLYVGCVSDYYDSVDDTRFVKSGADIIKQKCTVANATKEAGTWATIPSGGTGGQVDSVVAGTNISVDDTDPTEPIVSVTVL